LIPGPTWLSESLKDYKKLKLTNHPITNRNIQTRFRYTIEATRLQFGYPTESLRLGPLSPQYEEVDIDAVKTKIRENEAILTRLICDAQNHISLDISRLSTCSTKVKNLQNHKCLKHDYQLFQNHIEALQVPDPDSRFWQMWFEEPGRYFRIKYDSDNHTAININEITTILMTRIWIRAMFLAMAKKQFSDKVDHVEMPIFGLHRNIEKELGFRVVSPTISLGKILQNRVCTDCLAEPPSTSR